MDVLQNVHSSDFKCFTLGSCLLSPVESIENNKWIRIKGVGPVVVSGLSARRDA